MTFQKFFANFSVYNNSSGSEGKLPLLPNNKNSMNIWEAYCNHGYYNIYFNLLVAKGMKKESAENLKEQYFAYLQRIKTTKFAKDLKAINSREEFLNKLHDIFEVKWKDHINEKYKEIIPHFYNYLKFLDSMQALHGDFLCKEEKTRLINITIEDSLTEYETEYLVDGKLVALMNPSLLYTLREYIVERNISPSKVTIACKNFYGTTLDMSSEDYLRLINDLWTPSRRIKKGRGRNKIRISYHDGSNELYTTLEALKQIVLFYGFDEVSKTKLKIRDEYAVTKYVGYGKENVYEEMGDGIYINKLGNAKDRMNLARAINKIMGCKLNIELE